MSKFELVVNPALVPVDNGRMKPLFCKIEIKDGNLSISGVVDPWTTGNAGGGCGQVDMEFAHRNLKDNDKRYANPIQPEQMQFTEGWNKDNWLEFLDVWHNWHLNDMQAGCEHQRALGWTYEEHHDPKSYQGEACPVCGYSIGSKWLKQELPAKVVAFLRSLPQTKVEPAWV